MTGDIANKGLKKHYEQFSKQFLRPLAQILGVDPADRIILVPGNHDIDRTEARFVKIHELLS
jgi:3',5'-cyclic AMP phosphodiesterase CpdA